MKLLIISCLVALTAADVSHIVGTGEQTAEILKQSADVNPDGSYNYAYETSNGIAADASGQLKGTGEEAAVIAQGHYSYTNPEGTKVDTIYVADENGFQPQGAHLPTPHPIPEAIKRSLEFIRANPPPPEKN